MGVGGCMGQTGNRLIFRILVFLAIKKLRGGEEGLHCLQKIFCVSGVRGTRPVRYTAERLLFVQRVRLIRETRLVNQCIMYMFVQKLNTYLDKNSVHKSIHPSVRHGFIFLYFCLFSFYNILAMPCSSNPCRNGGYCYTYGNRYYCRCRFGYSGQNCETGETNNYIQRE